MSPPVIQIEGFWWFVGAILICGVHALYIRSWRREHRKSLAWWTKYDADAQHRHEDFMRAIHVVDESVGDDKNNKNASAADHRGRRGESRNEERIAMKAQNWVVSARYAAPGSRPGNRRHPAPEDFCRRTVVGPPEAATVEAVLDLLEVPENERVKIRADNVVRDFVKNRLVPDHAYPHHTVGAHYVSSAPEAQLVEWTIEFAFVTQVIGDQATGGVP